MQKKQIFSFIALSTTLYLNAVSNNELPEMGHAEDSPLKNFYCNNQKIMNIRYAFQGLHSINKNGYYITTKEIAKNLKFLKDESGHQHAVIYKEHDNLNLALVVVSNALMYGPINLNNLGTSEDLKQSPWVLSLTKNSNSKDSTTIYNNHYFDLPLCAVSKINEQDTFLILNRGDLEDFYEQSGIAIRNSLIKKEQQFFTNIVKNLEQKNYDLVQDNINNKIEETNLEISDLQNHIDQLTHTKEFLQNKLNKISQSDKKLYHLWIQKLKDRIDYDQFFLYKIKTYNTNLDYSTKKQYCEYSEYICKLSLIISKYIFDMPNKPILEDQINKIWCNSGKVYNGVADSNDIGGGIYSSSIDGFDQQKLIGITIPGGNEGETSTAINLTTPAIKDWITKTIEQFYQGRKEDSPNEFNMSF